MSTHTRAQLGRVIRLMLVVLAALLSTAPIQDAAARYPTAAAIVAAIEAAYRQFFPTIPAGQVLKAYRDREPPGA